MSEAAIVATGLGKRYRLYDGNLGRLRELLSPTRQRYSREHWAVRGLDFEIPRGSTVGILGRNGAGKSTTLRLIAGFLRASEGSVAVHGRVTPVLGLGTGLQPALSGRKNARINALFMGLDPWRIEGRLDEILEFAELGEYADQPLETYSSGMRTRLAFAVLTVLEPEILLLDEALSGGDPIFGKKCQGFIRRLCRSGTTVVVVSHSTTFLEKTCDEVLWLERGRLRDRGGSEELVSSYLGTEGERDARARPTNCLLRLWTRHAARLRLDSVEWLGPRGGVLGQVGFGQPEALEAMVARAEQLGVAGDLARFGWGEVEASGSFSGRVLSFADAPEGGLFLALPVPAAPTTRPTAIRFTGRFQERGRVRVSAMVNGGSSHLGVLKPHEVQKGAELPLTRLWRRRPAGRPHDEPAEDSPQEPAPC